MHEATKDLINDILDYPSKMNKDEIFSNIWDLQFKNPVAFREIKRRAELCILLEEGGCGGRAPWIDHYESIWQHCDALEDVGH